MDSRRRGMFALSLRTALPYTLPIFVGYVLMCAVAFLHHSFGF
ncbi:hypothetical protein [Helicobacter sp.]|nr:hypothetical protein [Helicobacter sp.]